MGLKVWFPFLGDLNQQGCSDVKATNLGAVTSNNNGKIGKCMSFNGSATGALRLPPVLKATDDFSICFWVKFNNLSVNHCLFSQRTAINDLGFTIFWIQGQTGIRLDAGGQTSGGYTRITSTAEWYHVVCCRDKSYKRIYINGELIKEAAYTTTQASNVNSNYAIIGGSQNSSGGSTSDANYLNGYLNDYRIYDHCLSAAEVREISQGLVLHYKLDTLTNPNLLPLNSNLTSSWVADGLTMTQDGTAIKLVYGSGNRRIYQNTPNTWTTSGDKFTVSFEAKASANNVSIDLSRSNTTDKVLFTLSSEWQHYSGTFTNTASVTNGTLSIRGNTSGSTFWIKNIKLEKGEIETRYIEYGVTDNTIKDSSGYNHNGTIIGNPNLASGNGRYSAYMRFPDNTGHIQCGIITTSGFSNSYTFAWWGTKSAAGTMFWGFQDGIRLNGLYNNTLWNTGDGSNNPIYKIGTTTTITAPTVAEWHHYAMTGNGTKCYLYVDGQLYGEAKTYKSINGTQLWINGWQNSTNYSGYMNMSDFRVYCTALDADAIRQLYEVGTKVDNKGNLHAFELDEFGKNQLTKTGIMKDYMIEPYKTLPDGSHWQLMLFHYVDGGKNLFTSSNATYCNDFGLYSRLRDINNVKYDSSKYEFYVIQDGVEYRWTQTSQPTASSIAGKTVVSGYADPVNGLAKANQSNTYIGYSSWWGACGCYKSFTSGGRTGIPGFGTHDANGICAEYLALYARISDSKFKLATQNAYASNFIEI